MFITLVVAVVGLVIWWIPANSKVNETGKILFILGTAFTLYMVSGRLISL